MAVQQTDNGDNGAITLNADDATDIALVVQSNNVDKISLDAAGDVKAVQIRGIDAAVGIKLGVSGGKIGFYGTTPITKAVLATGTGKTVDNVITALQNLGLVSQT